MILTSLLTAAGGPGRYPFLFLPDRPLCWSGSVTAVAAECRPLEERMSHARSGFGRVLGLVALTVVLAGIIIPMFAGVIPASIAAM